MCDNIHAEIIQSILDENLSSYIKDDILVEKDDIRGDSMDLRFKDNSTMYAYILGVANTTDKIKLVNKYVYETKKMATATSTKLIAGDVSLLRCEIDIRNCMDLSDAATYKDLKNYYKNNLEQAKIKEGISDIALIKLYAKDKGFKCVRMIHMHSDRLHKESTIQGSMIRYYILNESCILNTEKILDL